MVKCPQLVMRQDYEAEGYDKLWQSPLPCGEPLRLHIGGVADLDQFGQGDLVWDDLSREVYVHSWRVECDAGHVLVIGQDDGNGPAPFTLDQVRAAGVEL